MLLDPLEALRRGVASSGARSVAAVVQVAAPLLGRALRAQRLALFLYDAHGGLRAAAGDAADAPSASAWPGARVTRRRLCVERAADAQLMVVYAPAPDEPPGVLDAVLDGLVALLERAAAQGDADATPEAAPLPAAASEVVGHGERIAVVDDHPALARATSRLVETLGYAPTSFSSARALLAAVEQDPRAFDLVLTDQSMPDLTGVELALALRERRVGVPVLLVTGLVSSIDVSAVAPPVRVLGKPYRGEELIDALVSLLGR